MRHASTNIYCSTALYCTLPSDSYSASSPQHSWMTSRRYIYRPRSCQYIDTLLHHLIHPYHSHWVVVWTNNEHMRERRNFAPSFQHLAILFAVWTYISSAWERCNQYSVAFSLAATLRGLTAPVYLWYCGLLTLYIGSAGFMALQTREPLFIAFSAGT